MNYIQKLKIITFILKNIRSIITIKDYATVEIGCFLTTISIHLFLNSGMLPKKN